jgi:pimeloyl-ACP methyl ester carboxylesterase
VALVVGVHGIGKQVEGGFTLGWSGPLRSGVALARGPELTDADIAMAFYGSLFRKKLAKGAADPLYTDIDVQDQDEIDLLEAWWQAASAEPGPGGEITKGRAPGSVQAALRGLGQLPFFAGVAEHLLIADLKQVTRYLHDAELRAEIQACVRAAIGPDTRVVVGHSLGSVIAYEVLAASPGLDVRTLVTLGSPLGIPRVIFDQLTPPPAGGAGAWPGGVRQWHNIADPGDVVALVKQLSPLFGGRVSDWLVYNGAKAHDAKPYLTAEETGRAIVTGLGD